MMVPPLIKREIRCAGDSYQPHPLREQPFWLS